MDAFFDSPAHAAVFPRRAQASPTARLLTGNPGPQALEAAADAGMIDPAGFAERDEDGVPALARWITGFQNTMALHTLEEGPWHWPPTPAGRWEAMTEPPTQNHRKATHQAERIAGWCIAHAPPGLASARWTHPTPTTGRMRPSPPDSTGLACVLAYQRWAPVLEQLLARPDAPDAQQVQALRAICLPGLLKGAIASDQGPVLDKAHSAYEPLLHQALHDEDLATARVLLAHGVSPHHANDAGVPAWYYARSPRALELLIAHGLDPARAGECRLAPAAWWAHALGSSQAAAPMVSCYNQWLQQALSDEERARATLIQLAGSLENDASLATLRAQMQGLGRLVHGE